MVLYTWLLSLNSLEICFSIHNTFFARYSYHFRPYVCYCLKGNFIIFTDLQKVLFFHLYLWRNRMLNTIPTNTIITFHIIRKFALQCEKWKTTANVNFVYVSLLKQQGNCDFESISVLCRPLRLVIYVTSIQFRYNHMIWRYNRFDFFWWQFLYKNISIEEKIHSGFVFFISYYWYWCIWHYKIPQ